MGPHRENAYYQLVGLELGGGGITAYVSGCAVQCGVCCAAFARYIVGEILWLIDQYQFLREAVG